MELVIPTPSMDFNFDSACSSPYIPSSPKRFGDFYFSAPTSPTRASAIYNDFHNLSSLNNGSISNRGGSSSVIPFDWEEKPGTPKSNDTQNDDDDGDGDEDFEFGFNGQFDKVTLTADELFDGGKIRPLKPPPGLQLGSRLVNESTTGKSPVSSPRSPRSPRSPIAQGKKMFRDAFSPRQRKEIDPFAVAIEQSRTGAEQARGRERSSNSNRRVSRSLSPFRVSEFAWEEQQQQQPQQQQQQQQPEQQLQISKPASLITKTSSSSSSSSTSSSSFMGYRKWKLKDFLLFRSASEGRASDKDPFRKFAVLSKKNEDSKNTSFRSTNSNGSRRKESVSPHELHYTANRAVSEDLKKKTFLPYKQGLLGVFGIQSSRPRTR